MNYVHGPAASQVALPPPAPAPAQKRVRANTTPLPRSSYHRPLPYPRQL